MLHKFTMGCFHNATCAPWETRAACDVLGRLTRRAGRRSVAGFVASLVGLAVVLLAPMRAAAQAPAAEDTLAAFSAVQHAVRAWGPIGEGEKVPGAAGACVTLKLRGEMIGRGIAWSGSASAPASGDTVVRDALAEAMKQAEPRLGAPNDAMREQAIREIARNVVVSVELAGPLSAIEPATWEEAESSLRPGLDGVAVRGAQGKGVLHAVFPSQMMLTNELPHRALGGAVARCLGEGGAAAALDQPKKIREGHGIRMYSFRVGQAVQGSPTGGPLLLYRGGRLLAPNEILTTAQVRDMGAEAAQFLLRNGGPRAGNPDCPRGTLSQLLALYAVGRWTQATHNTGLTVDTPL
ncbi:MAG TPA: hypothetical protein VHC70_05390, partial [Phycisphaerales bacterium]|nr:hypothetical protein [Phycisphaerales bacterium]